MTHINDTDLTSEELAPRIVDAALSHIPFDGWTNKAIDRAASDLGIGTARAHLVFPGGGEEMMFAWLALEQDRLRQTLADMDLMSLKIRNRIKTAIMAKFAREATHKDASRRALSVLALPHNAGKSAKHVWRAADIMWRAAGDDATDFNHYSKRMILSGILSATMLYFLNDDSDNHSDTEAFVDRRIADVMQIEKVKASLRKVDQYRPSLTRFLGRMRYPSR